MKDEKIPMKDETIFLSNGKVIVIKPSGPIYGSDFGSSVFEPYPQKLPWWPRRLYLRVWFWWKLRTVWRKSRVPMKIYPQMEKFVRAPLTSHLKGEENP